MSRVERPLAEAVLAHADFLTISPQVTVTMLPAQVIARGGEGGGGTGRRGIGITEGGRPDRPFKLLTGLPTRSAVLQKLTNRVGKPNCPGET